MSQALHVGQRHHQPWCRIYHNPAIWSECWCDSQVAVSAYKLGQADGFAQAVSKEILGALQRIAQEVQPAARTSGTQVIEQQPAALEGK